MKNVSVLCMLLVVMTLTSMPTFAADDGLVAHWKFDDIDVERRVVEMVRGETHLPKELFAYTKEEISGEMNDLNGKYYEVVKGVKDNAVLLDGYTAHVAVSPDNSPLLSTGDFGIETWIALGAYPKNICPIVDHQTPLEDGYVNGYYFGIDALGRLMFQIGTNGKYEILLGEDRIPLNEWTHVACTYSVKDGMKIFINGKHKGTLKPKTRIDDIRLDHREHGILIGKSRSQHRPYGTIRPEGTMKSFTFLDGLIDELKLYNKTLSGGDIKASYNDNKTSEAPQLPERILPSGPKGPAKFGAINTTLKYYPSWDAPWQLSDITDVVVRFDETPCRFVFWHGTGFIPHWVTENNICFNNGFNEGWNEHGSCEPMSDKRCIYSTVKVVESNEARVVVQWRYGLVDVTGVFAFEDPATGWGDWTNETFVIYPNMVGVRVDTLLSNAPNAAHEWQESMMVMGPGQRPDEVLKLEALSLANDKGESKTYSWRDETPPHLPDYPPNPNIQTVNTQSEYHPFSAVRAQDKPKIDIYSGEVRRDVCVFPWWNHWPVAPRPTDGRYAMYDDRASHASLSHWLWEPYETTDKSMTKLMLNGMTDKSVEELVPLTWSWDNPSKATVVEGNFTSDGYDPAELAYQFTCKDANEPEELEVKFAAKERSPLVDPAFVLNNWGYGDAELKINGKTIEKGKDCRMGYRERLEGTDLIVWVRYESDEATTITITPED